MSNKTKRQLVYVMSQVSAISISCWTMVDRDLLAGFVLLLVLTTLNDIRDEAAKHWDDEC